MCCFLFGSDGFYIYNAQHSTNEHNLEAFLEQGSRSTLDSLVFCSLLVVAWLLLCAVCGSLFDVDLLLVGSLSFWVSAVVRFIRW